MTTTVLSQQLDRFIPLPKAARRLKLSEKTLRTLVETGKIRAAVLSTGEIVVNEQSAMQVATYEQINEQLRAIRREDFNHLHGQLITIAEAVEKYDIPGMTVRGWVRRAQVAVIDRGHGMKLDEADVAYCAKVYSVRKTTGSLSGAPLLDDEGRPNLLKHPGLSEYRRRKKTGPLVKQS
jgi:hypothetical protein